MSGITLKQLLMSVNRYTNVIIEDEFNTFKVGSGTVMDFLGFGSVHKSWLKLDGNQLEQTYDYIRINAYGTLVIGIDFEKFTDYFMNMIGEEV